MKYTDIAFPLIIIQAILLIMLYMYPSTPIFSYWVPPIWLIAGVFLGISIEKNMIE